MFFLTNIEIKFVFMKIKQIMYYSDILSFMKVENRKELSMKLYDHYSTNTTLFLSKQIYIYISIYSLKLYKPTSF